MGWWRAMEVDCQGDWLIQTTEEESTVRKFQVAVCCAKVEIG
jgi:hypothetical protein